MRSILTCVLLALCLAGTSGCNSTKYLSAPPTLSESEIAAQYKLGSGDQVRITVFNQTNLSGDYLVDGAGFISLPLIGPIKAGGKTSGDLTKFIAAELVRGGFLVNPSVAVQVSVFRPYYILGEVTQPGSYPYSSSLTVRKAVAAAHGFTYRANTKRVFIQRAGEDDEYLYELTPSLVVLPGDTIRIPERMF
jgi:protein involved in polysaccharide export with SLBB domain